MARQAGIHLIDTASLYGESESVLGRIMPPDDVFLCVTKTPRFGPDMTAKQAVEILEGRFRKSLKRLGRTCIYGLLVHDANDLLGPISDAIFETLTNLKKAGAVQKIGVSIYTGEQIDGIVSRYDMDIVQVPVSVLDQRLVQSGHLHQLKNLGVEIHARSVLLQGLLVSPVECLDPRLEAARPVLERYKTTLLENRRSPLEGALNFVRSISELDYILIGVQSSRQISEMVSAFETDVSIDYHSFAISDPVIVDPRTWVG